MVTKNELITCIDLSTFDYPRKVLVDMVIEHVKLDESLRPENIVYLDPEYCINVIESYLKNEWHLGDSIYPKMDFEPFTDIEFSNFINTVTVVTPSIEYHYGYSSPACFYLDLKYMEDLISQGCKHLYFNSHTLINDRKKLNPEKVLQDMQELCMKNNVHFYYIKWGSRFIEIE